MIENILEDSEDKSQKISDLYHKAIQHLNK